MYFTRPDLGLNIGPFPIQNWEKTSQNGVYHSQFLSSTVWWTFHENPNKNSSYRCMKFCIKMWMKTCFIHIFMQIFMSFYDGQLKQQICYSFTGSPVLSDWIKFFPILMVKMLFSQIKQTPGPDFRKVGESLDCIRDNFPFLESWQDEWHCLILMIMSLSTEPLLFGPRRNKTCLWGFWQRETQTSLLSYKD